MSSAIKRCSSPMAIGFLALGMTLGLGAGSGCVVKGYRPVVVKPGRGHGPPPHAPAHGYRHKHRGGIELVFDSGLGVYAVVGYPGIYFLDDSYYRLVGSSWSVSATLDGGWRSVSSSRVPQKLFRAKSKGSHGNGNPGRGRGRGR